LGNLGVEVKRDFDYSAGFETFLFIEICRERYTDTSSFGYKIVIIVVIIVIPIIY
jgi:hypothetical protein